MNDGSPHNNQQYSQPYGYPQQPSPVSNAPNPALVYPSHHPQQPSNVQRPLPAQGAAGPLPGGPTGNPAHSRQLTREEIAVLKECQSESFWRRSLPLAIAGSFGVNWAFKYGYFKPSNLKFFHYSTAIGVGYFLGKLLYIKPCMEKLKTLKNSPLSDALSRSGRRSEVFQDMSQLPGLGSMPELQRDDQQAYPSDPYHHQGPALVPSQNVPPTLSSDPGRKTSYDELRNKNRAEYWRKQQNMYAPLPTTPVPQQNNGAQNQHYQPPHPGPNAYPQPSSQDPSWMNPNQNQPRDDRESRHDDDVQNKQTKYFDQSNARYPKSSRRKYEDNDFS